MQPILFFLILFLACLLFILLCANLLGQFLRCVVLYWFLFRFNFLFLFLSLFLLFFFVRLLFDYHYQTIVLDQIFIFFVSDSLWKLLGSAFYFLLINFFQLSLFELHNLSTFLFLEIDLIL